ncbi:MAG TPA: DUF5777 family beta-barrel protein [Mucilaginibacter sp.]|nr:DUF5777 family beta-barrel protein [Mucilaginibacter sp.]
MKLKINLGNCLRVLPIYLVSCLFLHSTTVYAQDSTAAAKENAAPVKARPVKNTFQSVWLIDDQTSMVPIKGTFEFDIQHRFGTVNNGYSDLWGLFASSNIRLGLAYAPINNLYIGVGLNKFDELADGSAKYAILKQTPGLYPVSITYYGDLAYDTRSDKTNSLFKHQTDRLISFNSIIISRKFGDKLSLQVSPNISHQNSVQGYITKHDSTGVTIFEEMKHDQFGISLGGRYKISESTAFIIDYAQPITREPTHNPSPNLSFGFEFATSGHTFQIFMGNYSMLNPAKNSFFNTNSPFGYTQTDGTTYKGGMFVIGFNITRLWNF